MGNYYEMLYFRSASDKKTHKFWADNDDEAVELAKGEFLKIAETESFPETATLDSVYREPNNLLKRSFKLSVTKGKDIYSLIEH